jgi:hypothetical protein
VNHFNFTEFEVLTTVIMKISIFWLITSCSLVNVNRRFVGIYRFHIQQSTACCLFHDGLLLGLLTNPVHEIPPFVFILSQMNPVYVLMFSFSHICDPGSSLVQVMWDLWWTKWHCGRFSPSTSVSPANSHSPIAPRSSSII